MYWVGWKLTFPCIHCPNLMGSVTPVSPSLTRATLKQWNLSIVSSLLNTFSLNSNYLLKYSLLRSEQNSKEHALIYCCFDSFLAKEFLHKCDGTEVENSTDGGMYLILYFCALYTLKSWINELFVISILVERNIKLTCFRTASGGLKLAHRVRSIQGGKYNGVTLGRTDYWK